MSEESAHERMVEYEELAEKERQYRRDKESVLEDIGDELSEAVETAVEDTGVSVEVTSTSRDGTHQTLRARLDRATLVAAVSDALPDGFVVEHVNDDGTLTVQWEKREMTSDSRRAAAILKAIVAEGTETDEDGLIVSVPTREGLLARATELGVEDDLAERRLAHLADLDVVDIVEGEVYPATNFSKF